MDRLECYERVNGCETVEELKKAILDISKSNHHNVIMGRTRAFDGEKMSLYVEDVVLGKLPFNLLTRNYGIRQQALYISKYLR
jgi:hypothetical protein